VIRAARSLLLAALALAALPALAIDPPHDASMQSEGCQACHRTHSGGAALTNQIGNFNVCDQCHGTIVDADGKHFGFPWVPQHQAIPGAGGRSHRWDADATSRGARVPVTPDLAKRLDGGKLQCSTCHDQHNNNGRPGDPSFHGGSQHVSGDGGAAGTVGVGTAWTPNGPPTGAGTGQLQLATVTAAAAPKGYRVMVTATTGSTVSFKVSHDRGASWFAWSGSAWVVDTGLAGRPVALGTPVDLDDGANVRVSFTAAATSSYKASDYWEFWISYPMLRASNVDDAMCLDCHADRAHSALRVEGGDAAYPADGVNAFSHPVGEALTRSYDRTPATLLDANGAVQVSAGADADGNASNNLALDSSNRVRCTSCHAVHNADSNSLTQDAR
jgi:hypothetical protein